MISIVSVDANSKELVALGQQHTSAFRRFTRAYNAMLSCLDAFGAQKLLKPSPREDAR
jgi:hypothetical protein